MGPYLLHANTCCFVVIRKCIKYKPLIKSPVTIQADGPVSIVQVYTACESKTSVCTTVLFEKVILCTQLIRKCMISIQADRHVSIVQVYTACESQASVSTTVLYEEVVLPTLMYIAHHVQSSASTQQSLFILLRSHLMSLFIKQPRIKI